MRSFGTLVARVRLTHGVVCYVSDGERVVALLRVIYCS